LRISSINIKSTWKVLRDGPKDISDPMTTAINQQAKKGRNPTIKEKTNTKKQN
jgi:hypothetical protein